MATSHTGEVFTAFVIGGILGLGLGVLYAPASGKETRKKILGAEVLTWFPVRKR